MPAATRRMSATLAGWLRKMAGKTHLTSVAERWNRGGLLVVCYHGVAGPGDPNDWMLVPVRMFERQIEYLADRFRIAPLDEVLEQLALGQLSEPTACITFDDGYANNLTHAAPILRRYSAPATIYLVSDLVGSDKLMWTTEIEYAILDSDPEVLAKVDPAIDHLLGLSPRDSRLTARRVKQHLKTVDNAERIRLCERVLAKVGGSRRDLTAFRFLTWDEVESLDAEGLFWFGGHTRSHPILPRASNAVVADEIVGCVTRLSALWHQSTTFAYPNGSFDDRVVRVLRDLNVKGGVTTVPGRYRSGTDPFRIPRILVGGNDDFEAFVTAVSGLDVILRRRSYRWGAERS